MKKLMLYAMVLFFGGVTIGIAFEPQSFKDETRARVAEEKRLEQQLAEKNREVNPEQVHELNPGRTGSDSDAAKQQSSKPVTELEADTNEANAANSDRADSPVTNHRPASLSEFSAVELDKVTKVIDGDTIYTSKYKIRIIGVDTPETKDPRKPVECFGKEAFEKMVELVSGQEVYLEKDPNQGLTDKYGRALRNVYLKDGSNVAYEIIAQGYGHEYTYKVPHKWQAEYKTAEKDASKKELGLWSPSICDGLTSTATVEELKSPKQPVSHDPEITSISQAGKGVRVKGYASKNASFALRLASDEVYEYKSAEDGSFNVTLPASVSPYGSLTLQSVSGFWLFKSYKSLHDKYYYSMFSSNTMSDSAYEPIITKVEDADQGDDIEGFYLPDSKLLIKSGDDILSKSETNKDGYFRFENVKTSGDASYEAIVLMTYTSLWFGFGFQEGDTLAKAYLNTKDNKVFSELPIITKTEIKYESISFKKLNRNDSSLTKGETRISQKGENGKRKVSYRVTYRGDERVSTKEVNSKVETKPRDQITLVGTYVRPAVTPQSQALVPNSSGGTVKMSNSGICHAPGTTYYDRTTNFTPYNSLNACLSAGGRMPKR